MDALEPQRTAFEIGSGPHLLAIMAIGCTIAALAPFDVIFSAMTFGSASARVVVLAILALAGAAAASRTGLRLDGHGTKHPALIGAIAAFGVAVYVIVVDAYLFRSILSPQYVHFMHLPLNVRLLYFMPRSFNENILYRLFVFSSMVLALKYFRIASPSAIFSAMVLTQCINIGANVLLFEHPTIILIFYDILRYVGPGVLWAWLYLRFGFITAEIAAVGCHAFLQPMFSLFFQ